MRALPVLLALACVALAMPVGAQTPASPIQGTYDEVYVVAGRAVDEDGFPLSGGNVTIEVPGALPLKAGLNCKGDFIASFPIRRVEAGMEGKVTLERTDGGTAAEKEFDLDPFYRRSDVTVALDGPWNRVCTREQNVWEVSATIAVRILNRTEPYTRDGETYHARPYQSLVDLYFEAPGGNRLCAPHPQIQRQGVCERFAPDERGDVRYTFTLDQGFEGGGRMEVQLSEDRSYFVDVDPKTRLATYYLEATGQGAPPELYETPAPGALLALVALVGAAMAFSLKRR